MGAVSVLAGGAGSDPPGRIQAPRAAGGVQRLQSVHPDSAFGSIDVCVGPAIHAFTFGAVPEAGMRVGSTRNTTQPPPLPAVRAVATHHTD